MENTSTSKKARKHYANPREHAEAFGIDPKEFLKALEEDPNMGAHPKYYKGKRSSGK